MSLQWASESNESHVNLSLTLTTHPVPIPFPSRAIHHHQLSCAATGAPWRTPFDLAVDISRSNGATGASPYGMAAPSSSSHPHPTTLC
uniref:Uncharacterized protein n=1 Tax=Hordeum vulgare subsp. vulgare TaxID=112509 RepID=A0A8I6X9F2_HORVV